MNMENIIRERADILALEAIRCPYGADMARNWLCNALAWAERHSHRRLYGHIHAKLDFLLGYGWARLDNAASVRRLTRAPEAA